MKNEDFSGLTFKQKKELIELSHKYRLEEIKAERQAKLDCLEFDHGNKIKEERYKSNAILSAHRLKRADFKRVRLERQELEDDKKFMENYASEISKEEKK